MKRVTSVILLVVVLCAAYMIAGQSSKDGGLISPAYAQAEVTARAATFDGRPVGEVLMNNQVIFRVRTSAGGYSPFQRAEIMADRLNQQLGNSIQPEDITTGRIGGQEVVLVNGELIATADIPHARMNNSTPMGLANLWASRLENVVAGRSVNETPTGQKIVPIISVGSGTRIGGAVVAGSEDALDDVVAVAQVEGQFGNSVRLRVLVPVSTEDVVREIRRVPETSVIGLADIRL